MGAHNGILPATINGFVHNVQHARSEFPRSGSDDGPLMCRSGRTRLALLAIGCLAVAVDVAAERLPARVYSTANGLAHNRVKQIVQDSRGFLWFCTADGLSRFDGAQFINFRVDDGLPAASTNDLLEAADGVYWIATNSIGVVRFDLLADTRPPQHGAVAPRYTVVPVSRVAVTNRVNVLFRDRAGVVWAGTDGGLFRMAGGEKNPTFQAVPLGIPGRPDIQNQIWALAEDGAGTLWIGSKFGLIGRGADGRTIRYSIRPSLGDDVVSSLVIDRKGALWVGHRSGLIALDPAQTLSLANARDGMQPLPRDARRYTTADGLANDFVLALSQAADGRLWIRTFGPGITIFDGTTFRAYEIGHRIADSGSIDSSLAEDRDGNVWMGTPAAGAVKLTAHGWVTYGEADGLGEQVGFVFENHAGELYASSRAFRISRFTSAGFTTVKPALRPTVTDATWRDWSGVLQDRAGDWWIGTREGLYRFSGVGFDQLARARPTAIYTTRDGLANDDIARLFEDARGDIWIAAFPTEQTPVTRWERATNRFYRYGEPDGLRPFNTAVFFGQDAAGSVWIGFRDGAIARYRRGRFSMVGPEAGLPVGGINGFYLDRSGRLWLPVFQSGVCRIDEPDADRPRVSMVYTRAHGLSSTQVYAVTGDLDGRIYIAHSRGIDRLDPRTGGVKRYSTADGLTGSEVRTALRDRGGALWFCTTSGASHLVPGAEPPLAPPPIRISGVRIAGVGHPLSALGETAVSLADLDPSQNSVQIEFFGLDLRRGEALRYQYRLEGSSADWSPLSAQRTVHFANLASGAYRFLVRAVNADGTPSPTPAAVSFGILPPIWRRWWFLSLATALVALVAGVFVRDVVGRKRAADTLRRSREERLEELERVRKRIATDLHDDVGSSLTRISLLSEVVQQRLARDQPSLVDPLASIAGLSRELVDSMSDIVWAINPAKDHLQDLSQRMRRFASDVLTARGIGFRFRTPVEADGTALGANLRRELFLIFKEAVNNVVRHSECSEAELDLTAEPDALILRVIDNGRGFDPDCCGNGGVPGHGLASMQARTEGLGGMLQVVSRPGQGTALTVRIPVSDYAAGQSAPREADDGNGARTGSAT
jgi:signal transduction histidine kinase/ligand-binding sensor domain-containing protein